MTPVSVQGPKKATVEKGSAPTQKEARVAYYATWQEKEHLQLQVQLDQAEWYLTALSFGDLPKTSKYFPFFFPDSTKSHSSFSDASPVSIKILFFLFKIIKINFFHVFWEMNLPSRILASGQNLQERRQASIAASKARTEARRAAEAKSLYEKKKRLLLPLIVKAKALISRHEAASIIAAMKAADEHLPSNWCRKLSAAELKAEKAVSAYADICAKVWRVKRQEKTALRLAEEKAFLKSLNFRSATPRMVEPKRRRLPRHLAPAHPAGALSDLLPYKGLGAVAADPSCKIIVALAPLSKKRPDFVSAVYSFLMGPRRDLLPMQKVYKICSNLIHLSDWYPHEALTEELNKLADEASCEEAYDAISSETLKLDALLEEYNLKADDNYGGRARKWLGKVAGNIKDAASDLGRKFLSGCEQAGEKMATGVFSVIMKNFYEALATIKHELGVAKTLLDALVAKVKDWYYTILNKTHEALKTLGFWSACALGIICGVGLCTLTEKVLLSMGVSCAGFLSTIFCTACFAWLGLKLAGGCDEVLREMQIHLTHLAKHMFADATVQKNGLGEDLNAKSIPVLSSVVSALGAFGTSLVGFRTETVIEIGKIGAACHSMRMGKEALKEFGATMLYYMGRIADKVTGRETVFFDELSVLIQVDVRSWIKRAQGVLVEANYTPLSNLAFSDVVNRLVADGEKLQSGVAGVPRKLSMDFGHLVGTIMKDLHDIQKKIVRCGPSDGRRKEPCWIYVFGDSHVGKSNLMDYLALELCKHFDLPHTVCPRNGRDPFFSGYSRQTVLQIDDLSAIRTDPPLEGELINLVSCQEYPLNMADVADKPIYFQSPFIVSSSNMIEAPAGCGIRHTEAYRNRRAVLIKMRRKPNAQYNPDDIFAAAQICFYDPESQAIEGLVADKPDAEWMDVPDAMTEILNRASLHRREQDRLQVRYMEKFAVQDPILLASEKFLKEEARKHLCYLDQARCEEAGMKTTAGAHFLCVDEQMFVLSSSFQFEEVVPEHPQYAEWEKACLETFLGGVQASECIYTRSMIVTGFLRNMVQGESAVISVEEMASTASAIQKRLFSKLDLGEKIFLRLLQKKVDSQLKDSEFNPYSNTVWIKLIESVGASREFVASHGGNILLLASAMIVIIVLCYGFIKVFIGLMTGSMSLAAAIGGTKEVDLKAQSSSAGQDKGYRNRNIPVHQRYTYARGQEKTGMPPAASLCVAIYGTRGHFVSALQYENKSIMMTRHQSRFFQEGEQLTCIFASTGESKLVRWHEIEVMDFPQQEIVLWMAPSLPDLPHLYRGLFLKDREAELPNNFKLLGYVLRQDKHAFHYDTLDTYASVENICLPVKAIINNELYRHEIPRRIAFHYNARNDDCGMLILAQIAGKLKIVGLLVAGKESTSWADILPNPQLGELKATMEYEPEFGEAEDGFFRIGYVEANKAPTMPTKTNLVKVPAHLQVPTNVPIKEPAIISAKDPRCPEGVDPPLQALRKKFSHPMGDLDQKLLDEVAQDIIETWYDCENHVLEDAPLSLAINGMPAGIEKEGSKGEFEEEIESFILKTSPGYPYFRENRATGSKGKEAYFQEAPDGSKELKKDTLAYELYENLVQFTKSEVPELVVIECPKDEPLPERKVKMGACRLFEIMPLHYNLFLRVKTLNFSRFLQRNRNSLPCQVGINAYSREWSHIFQRLLNKNDQAINCDYSAFDGLMTAQVVECIAKMINKLYSLSGEGEISQAQRFNMIMALHGRLAMVGRKLYRVNSGIPSGFALTVVINSIFNELLMRYAFKKMAPRPQRNLFTGVTLLVYGDDNLMSCDPNIAEWYNGESIRMCLKDLKVTITDGSDKLAPTIEWKPLSELDFLKRKFKITSSGVVQAPLDLSAIYTSLYWLTPDASKLRAGQKGCDFEGEVDVVDELLLNANVALAEIYLYEDREFFDRIREFYVRRFPLLKDTIRTWAFCESFHSGQQTGMLRWDPARVLDAMIGPDFARFMRVSEQGNKAHFYSPTLGVAGPFYKAQPHEFLVSTTMLKEGEQGFYIPVTIGAGVGGLPTTKWVKDFGASSYLKDNRGFLCRDAILAQYNAGKTLIFRDRAPYVAGNAALIRFAASARLLDQKEALHLYRNVIPEATDGLERYFDAPIPAAQMPGKFYFANGTTYAHLQEFKDAQVCNFEGGVREVLNDASRARKIPCLSAAQKGTKCEVALVCDHKMCPHHYVTNRDFKSAFEACWLARCKSPGVRVGAAFGLRPGSTGF